MDYMQKNIYITARAMVNVLSVILHKKNVILKPVAKVLYKKGTIKIFVY